jgi:protein gp37
MADKSAIEWTDATWNPVTGCTKITRGCDNCYAARFSERFRGVPGHPFSTGFDLTLRPERLDQPLKWSRPRMIFVNSMSDLFHKRVPRAFVDRVFDTMEAADWHVFQVLTKRSSLMRRYLRERYGDERGPAHIWCGVSVEDARGGARIAHLRDCAAGVRFLSIEPLIGPVGQIDLTGVDWVIAGGESGPGARPIHLEWAREVRDQCLAQGVAFFFKQWGGFRPKAGGRELDGREWSEFPQAGASGVDAFAPGRGYRPSHGRRLFDPRVDGIVGVGEGFHVGGPVRHATRQVRHGSQIAAAVALAQRFDEDGVARTIHGSKRPPRGQYNRRACEYTRASPGVAPGW